LPEHNLPVMNITSSGLWGTLSQSLRKAVEEIELPNEFDMLFPERLSCGSARI